MLLVDKVWKLRFFMRANEAGYVLRRDPVRLDAGLTRKERGFDFHAAAEANTQRCTTRSHGASPAAQKPIFMSKAAFTVNIPHSAPGPDGHPLHRYTECKLSETTRANILYSSKSCAISPI